jgi:hypothetical protein
VVKTYDSDTGQVHALRMLDAQFAHGSFTAATIASVSVMCRFQPRQLRTS